MLHVAKGPRLFNMCMLACMYVPQCARQRSFTLAVFNQVRCKYCQLYPRCASNQVSYCQLALQHYYAFTSVTNVRLLDFDESRLLV